MLMEYLTFLFTMLVLVTIYTSMSTELQGGRRIPRQRTLVIAVEWALCPYALYGSEAGGERCIGRQYRIEKLGIES